jgi:hypothetical protein
VLPATNPSKFQSNEKISRYANHQETLVKPSASPSHCHTNRIVNTDHFRSKGMCAFVRNQMELIEPFQFSLRPPAVHNSVSTLCISQCHLTTSSSSAPSWRQWPPPLLSSPCTGTSRTDNPNPPWSRSGGEIRRAHAPLCRCCRPPSVHVRPVRQAQRQGRELDGERGLPRRDPGRLNGEVVACVQPCVSLRLHRLVAVFTLDVPAVPVQG